MASRKELWQRIEKIWAENETVALPPPRRGKSPRVFRLDRYQKMQELPRDVKPWEHRQGAKEPADPLGAVRGTVLAPLTRESIYEDEPILVGAQDHATAMLNWAEKALARTPAGMTVPALVRQMLADGWHPPQGSKTPTSVLRLLIRNEAKTPSSRFREVRKGVYALRAM